MSRQPEYRLTTRALTRALVYAALIVASIMLWWAVLQLLVDVGSIRVPTG